jgi:hypothetical protein
LNEGVEVYSRSIPISLKTRWEVIRRQLNRYAICWMNENAMNIESGVCTSACKPAQDQKNRNLPGRFPGAEEYQSSRLVLCYRKK